MAIFDPKKAYKPVYGPGTTGGGTNRLTEAYKKFGERYRTGGTRQLVARRATARAAPAPTAAKTDWQPWLTAMEETQRRAAEDRAAALAEIRAREQKGLTALAPWQAQIQALEAEPEVIGEAGEARIFEAARTPIESEAQEAMRTIQESFAPGGFRQARIGAAGEAKTGQLASIRSRIKLERMARKREDVLNVMRQRAQYGETVAGIQERGGKSLAELYGRTITKVPAFSAS